MENEEMIAEIFKYIEIGNQSDQSKPIILSLYEDIKVAIESEKNNAKTEKQLECKKDMMDTELIHSKYVPKEVNNYINDSFTGSLDSASYVPTKVHYKTKIGRREVDIFFILFEKTEKLDSYVNFVISWLMVLDKYSKNECSKRLKIYFIMTNLKKNLPLDESDILGPTHCNSAVAYVCAPQGQILVYRKQEWFKVFIHETFHSYGLDFSDGDTSDFNQKLATLFPIRSEFNLFESYTEFWATIINCIYNSYELLGEKNDCNRFQQYFDSCIKIEQIFSLVQCVKILNFMGLSYNQLFNEDSVSRKYLYKEKTNVFAYYIMKSVLLYKYDDFLMWCKKNNKQNILQFEHLKAFYKFIEKHYQDHAFLEDLNKIDFIQMSNLLKKTMRMTLMEIV